MKLEEQVCSLELAKRLKELGCKQESYFVWGQEHSGLKNCPWKVMRWSDPKFKGEEYGDFAAFTVAELCGFLLDLGAELTIEAGAKKEEVADHLARVLCQKLIQITS